MNLCKKLHDLPSVATDWQQTTWCPDCEYYECGKCHDPIRTENNAPCPFDGKELPLREVTADPNNDQPQKPLDAATAFSESAWKFFCTTASLKSLLA